MMKFAVLFFVLLLSLSSVVVGGTLPSIPSNCFGQTSYCTSVEVAKDESGRRVIRVKIFAHLSKERFATLASVAARYLDFAKWPDYASSFDDLTFHKSEERRDVVGQVEKLRHLAHYTSKAPWPIKSMEVVDLVEYEFVTEQYPGSLYSAVFTPVAGFKGRKGVKHNVGELHIGETANKASWILYFVTDVVPDIELLPNVAAPYIHRPIHAIFKGMFDL
jgi:hypothetical protein